MKKINLSLSLLTVFIFLLTGCPDTPSTNEKNVSTNSGKIADSNSETIVDNPSLADLEKSVLPTYLFRKHATVQDHKASYPYPDATSPLVPIERGWVLAGGGCRVSWIQTGSHALAMVRSLPNGTSWNCKGADAPGVATTGDAFATGRWIRAVSPLVLEQKIIEGNKATTPDGSSQVDSNARIPDDMVKNGWVVTGGGCSSSHKTSTENIHAFSVVQSHPTDDKFGWFCKGAIPPGGGPKGWVQAYLVALHLADTTNLQTLDTKIFKGTQSGPAENPASTSEVSSEYVLTGGGCDVSFTPVTEYMVENSLVSETTWMCRGANPPNVPNGVATSMAYAIGLRIIKK